MDCIQNSGNDYQEIITSLFGDTFKKYLSSFNDFPCFKSSIHFKTR